MKFFSRTTLILLSTCLLAVLLSACGSAANSTPDPEPQPEVSEFAGAASYSGGAGKYLVICTNCSASIITVAACEAYYNHDSGDGTGTYERIIPSIFVIHGTTNYEGFSHSEIDANGSWVIKEQSIPYTREYDAPENRICTASAEFTVIMSNGGTITKFP